MVKGEEGWGHACMHIQCDSAHILIQSKTNMQNPTDILQLMHTQSHEHMYTQAYSHCCLHMWQHLDGEWFISLLATQFPVAFSSKEATRNYIYIYSISSPLSSRL